MKRRSNGRESDVSTQHGPIVLSSEPFDFTETDYYTATMGADLKKQFLAFERLIDPAALAGHQTRDQ